MFDAISTNHLPSSWPQRINALPNVRYWHETDKPITLRNVRAFGAEVVRTDYDFAFDPEATFCNVCYPAVIGGQADPQADISESARLSRCRWDRWLEFSARMTWRTSPSNAGYIQ